jgi:hypothetical protein
MRVFLPGFVVFFGMLLGFAGTSMAESGGGSKDKVRVTVLALPSKELLPSELDEISSILSEQIKEAYSVQVLSGRSVTRALWESEGSRCEEAASEFNKKVEEGKRAYQSLQIKKARSALQEASELENLCGAELTDAAGFRDLHLFGGLLSLAQGSEEAALEEFRMALSHDPELKLSGKQYPPDVIDAFGKAKKRLLSEKAVEMSVDSSPPGAAVFIDGKSRGETPLGGVPLYPGHHFVRLERSGFTPWTMEIPKGSVLGSLRAQLVPKSNAPAPKEMFSVIAAGESLDEPILAKLRSVSQFFGSDALLVVLLTKEGKSIHLGVRLFVGKPEILSKARLFNLGDSSVSYRKKIQGVVSTFPQLRETQRRPDSKHLPAIAYSDNSGSGSQSAQANPALPARPKNSEQDFLLLPPSGLAGDAAVITDSDGRKVAVPKTNPLGAGADRSDTGTPVPIEVGTATPWYKTWWFWTAVGAVVAGTATGLTLWAIQPEPKWTLVIRP